MISNWDREVTELTLKKSLEASTLPMSLGKEGLEWKPRTVKALGSCKQGTGHDNYLKGIIVQFDLTFTQYLSMQLQRYSWIDIVSSESKMHKITSLESIYDYCNDYVLFEVMEIVERLIKEYNADPHYNNFMTVISNIPMGFQMKMRISTNYLQLKTIYHQRKNHKLTEDWGPIIEFIKGLPMFEEIVLNGGDYGDNKS